jgi:hypothetical protein
MGNQDKHRKKCGRTTRRVVHRAPLLYKMLKKLRACWHCPNKAASHHDYAP